jgi:hypothetical protein
MIKEMQLITISSRKVNKVQCEIYVNNTDKGKKIAIPKMPTFKKQQQIERLLPGLKMSFHCQHQKLLKHLKQHAFLQTTDHQFDTYDTAKL